MMSIKPTRSAAPHQVAWVRSAVLLASLWLATLIASSAAAQSVDIPAALTPDLKAPPTIVTGQIGHQFQVDVEDDGTEMARTNAFFGVNHRIKLNDRSSLFLIGTYTLHQYDFDDNGGPANFYQWSDIHRLVFAGLVGFELNDQWRLIGGALVRSWGEGGAEFGDTLTAGALGGFDYHPNDDFSVGLLFGLFSGLESSASLIPVPTLKWKFADDWRLNVGMVQVLDPGIGAEVSFQINDTLSFGTGLAYQNRIYRLDGSRQRTSASNGRSTRDGIGQETEVPVFAMLQWRPTRTTAIDLLGGVAFGGKLRVESSTGANIASDSYDPAPFLGLKGQIAF